MRTRDSLRRWRLGTAIAGVAFGGGGLLAPLQPAAGEVEAVTLQLDGAHCAA